MPDSTSNPIEEAPQELVPKRIRSGFNQELSPPFKKLKKSELPTSTDSSAGSSPGSASDFSLEKQDVTASSLETSPSIKDGFDAEKSSGSPPSKVVTFTSPLEIGPSGQNFAEVSKSKSILVIKEDTPAPPPSPRLSNAMLPPPLPRPKNAMLPPPLPRPKNAMPPILPANAKIYRSKNSDEDEESMILPALASPSSSRPLSSKPVKLRLTFNKGAKSIISTSINRSSRKDPADDEGIDVADELYSSEESDSDEESDGEEGLDEETDNSKLTTLTAPLLTSSPMIRSSQVNRAILPKPSEAKNVPTEKIEMDRVLNKSFNMKNNGLFSAMVPNYDHDHDITYRGFNMEPQIEAHKCKLCIPYGSKISFPRREDPIVTGPLYRKILHLRRDSDKIITTAIEFTDALGEDNIHAFIDRAENDAYNAGMPMNLEPRILAVRWDNGVQFRNPRYETSYSLYNDPFVSVVRTSFVWRRVIEQMRIRNLPKQNWMIWWAEKDDEEDWEKDIP